MCSRQVGSNLYGGDTATQSSTRDLGSAVRIPVVSRTATPSFLTHAMTANSRMPILGVAHVNVSGLFSLGGGGLSFFWLLPNVRLTCCSLRRFDEIVSFRTQGLQAESREGVRAGEANETVKGERAPTIKRFGLQD
jgi:hypothetical protein